MLFTMYCTITTMYNYYKNTVTTNTFSYLVFSVMFCCGCLFIGSLAIQTVIFFMLNPNLLIHFYSLILYFLEIFRKILISTIVRWAEESQIETPKLVREMFR